MAFLIGSFSLFGHRGGRPDSHPKASTPRRPTPNPPQCNIKTTAQQASEKIINPAHKPSTASLRKRIFTAVPPCCGQSLTDLTRPLHRPGGADRGTAAHLLINFNLAFSTCLRINSISLLKAIRIKTAGQIPLIYPVLPGTSS